MKRTVMTLLAFTLLLAGASAQEKKVAKVTVIGMGAGPYQTLDSLELDSMYNYWNNYVIEHPKDEKAWRTLKEVDDRMFSKTDGKNREAALRRSKENNVFNRMAQAIPGTYTFYKYAYRYRWAKHREYADSAIAVIPLDAPARDYEDWTRHLLYENDTLKLTKLLTQYYKSGQYPAECLQYHYNELQGMEKGGVYLCRSDVNMIGKLILQLVLGVHKDKIICDMNGGGPFTKLEFERIGVPFCEELYDQLSSSEEYFRVIARIIRYVLENCKRPIYLPASDVQYMFKYEGEFDDLKACLYNEGLTMRYSKKPYDNMAVKRRNVEKHYQMEYLAIPFQPELEDVEEYKSLPRGLAFNYALLLNDLMPYYKKHNREQYSKLNRIFTSILKRIQYHGYGNYSVEYKTDGGPHYEFVEYVPFRSDPNDDLATDRKKYEEHRNRKENRRVLIITDPIEE